MNTLYRHILKNAWNIIMKFKYLWILGFFTAFLGNGGEYQILFKQIGLVANQTDSIVTWHDNLNAILPKLNLSFGNVANVVIYLIIAFAFLALFLSLCVASFGGLVKGSALANNNEKLTIRNLWKLGYNKFWPILGLIILPSLIVYPSERSRLRILAYTLPSSRKESMVSFEKIGRVCGLKESAGVVIVSPWEFQIIYTDPYPTNE